MKILHELLVLCPKRPDKSHARLAERKKHFRAIARDLEACGYSKTLRLRQLGGRHVQKLIKHWQGRGLTVGTIKNRLSSLRWALRKIHRAHVMHKTNDAYDLGPRPLAEESKAAELTPERLAGIRGRDAERMRISLRLQRWLGLRLEESLKIQPRLAIVLDGDVPARVAMHGSWCKNGRERTLEITTPEARDVLADALAIVSRSDESLIPPGKTYVTYRRSVYHQCDNIGLRPHALRHQYAQALYFKLTGHPAPIVNDKNLDWLDQPGANQIDHQARLHISAVLGHGRKHVTNAYLGSSRKRSSSSGR